MARLVFHWGVHVGSFPLSLPLLVLRPACSESLLAPFVLKFLHTRVCVQGASD